jgi:hypothetical protein
VIGAWTAENWAALAAWLTLLVLAGSLVFAWRQVREATRLREAQVRPFVILDFEVESVLIHISIENTGRIAARDVRFVFDPEMRSSRDDPWPPERSTLMSKGIPTLPPGKKYRFFLDSFPVRLEKSLPLTYEARVTYRMDGRKKRFTDIYTLDLTFLMGLGQVERRTIDDVAKALDAMKTDMHRWTESLNGIRVYIIDKETHDRESAIGMALHGLSRRSEGLSHDELREALREALRAAGETFEPPEEWVEAMLKGETFHYRLDDLLGSSVAAPPRNLWSRVRDRWNHS